MRSQALIIACVVALLAYARPAASSPSSLLLTENSLPPVAHTLFCQRYPLDCATRAPSSRFLLETTKALYFDLSLVHQRVNLSISPLVQVSRKPDATVPWQIAPRTGNCNDFAVTKRHELLQRGWPSWALLLAEVVLKTGEHHLVLVVNLRGDSFVLDNLEADPIWLVEAKQYRWNRIQSPANALLWLGMGSTNTSTEQRPKTRVTTSIDRR